MSNPNEPYITPGIAAKLLGVSKFKLSHFTRDGRLKQVGLLAGIGPNGAHEAPLFLKRDVEALKT